MESSTLRGGVIAETLLIPLLARAEEASRADALLRDERAAALVRGIAADFSRLRFRDHDRVAILMRAREFDRRARTFMAHHPRAVVVHLGCGLDTRFERVDDGRVEWFDLDLPGVIDLRRQLLGDSAQPRRHLLGGSVLDGDWIETVAAGGRRPTLFLAEGVLPYFSERQVRHLVLALGECFPGCELVCDALTPLFVRANNRKLRAAGLEARMRWGLRRGSDLEGWGADIFMLDEWYYFDRPEPRLGAMRLLRRIPFLARGAGIFHYQLGRNGGRRAGPG